MPPRKINFLGLGDYALAQEQAEREQAERAEKSRSGPPLALCYCGKFAPYAIGDFGRPDDDVQRFCSEHAPNSLKRPGDPRPVRRRTRKRYPDE